MMMFGNSFAGENFAPIASLYVYGTDSSQIVSMDKLCLTEEVTQASIEKAKKNMAKAITGEISKRKPLTVKPSS